MPRILRHGVVDSTNERAFGALAAGTAQDGDVHVARGQTAGRGRRGAARYSPNDEGLYLSYVHAPARPPLIPGLLTMASGLAVWDLGKALHLAFLHLRWPNDVMAEGGKVAGILVESRGYDPEAPRFVIGLGINVSQTSFPEELRQERPVTSLLLAGASVENDTLLPMVVEQLEARLGASQKTPRRLCADSLKATGLEGAEVRVTLGENDHIGLWEALSPKKGLVLRMMDGTVQQLDPSLVSSVEPTSPFL